MTSTVQCHKLKFWVIWYHDFISLKYFTLLRYFILLKYFSLLKFSDFTPLKYFSVLKYFFKMKYLYSVKYLMVLTYLHISFCPLTVEIWTRLWACGFQLQSGGYGSVCWESRRDRLIPLCCNSTGLWFFSEATAQQVDLRINLQLKHWSWRTKKGKLY